MPSVTPTTASALVFVADLDDPDLTEDDAHHLRRVLRLRPGATLVTADGVGGWRPCRLSSDGSLEVTGELQVVPPSPVPVTVAFALTKGGNADLAVQKLTELGVDRIVPFMAERSVVRWEGDKVARHMERFVTIVRHAAMQCRRVTLPAIGLAGADGSVPPPGGPGRLAVFADVAALPGASLADGEGAPPSLSASATVLVGPEGGWSEGERAAELPRVRLGAHVLRAETAALTAGALLVALRSDIVSTVVSSQALESP